MTIDDALDLSHRELRRSDCWSDQLHAIGDVVLDSDVGDLS